MTTAFCIRLADAFNKVCLKHFVPFFCRSVINSHNSHVDIKIMPVSKELFYITCLFAWGGDLGRLGSMKLNKKVIFYDCMLFYFLLHFIVDFFFLLCSVTFVLYSVILHHSLLCHTGEPEAAAFFLFIFLCRYLHPYLYTYYSFPLLHNVNIY